MSMWILAHSYKHLCRYISDSYREDLKLKESVCNVLHFTCDGNKEFAAQGSVKFKTHSQNVLHITHPFNSWSNILVQICIFYVPHSYDNCFLPTFFLSPPTRKC